MQRNEQQAAIQANTPERPLFILQFAPPALCWHEQCNRLTTLGEVKIDGRDLHALLPCCPWHHFSEQYSEQDQLICVKHVVLEYFKEKCGPASGVVYHVERCELGAIPGFSVPAHIPETDPLEWHMLAWSAMVARGDWPEAQHVYVVWAYEQDAFSLYEA